MYKYTVVEQEFKEDLEIGTSVPFYGTEVPTPIKDLFLS